MRKSKLICLVLIPMLIFPTIQEVYSTAETWNFQTITKHGTNPSLALDKEGNPHVSFNVGDLEYASWDGSKWDIETVDSNGYVGSLALDSKGNPHISYLLYDSHDFDSDTLNYTLMYASWTGSSWSIQVMEKYCVSPSLVLDSKDNPHLSYYNYESHDFKYASWDENKWNLQIVEQNDTNGYGGSLALDSNGTPHLCYFYGTSHQESNKFSLSFALRYAHWTGTKWDIQTIDSNPIPQDGASIAVDYLGHPHISYHGNDGLEYASGNGDNWNKQTIESYSGVQSTLILDSKGNPHIIYGGANLDYASWNGLGWDLQTIDQSNDIWGWAIALDSEGAPHICYSKPVHESDGIAYHNLIYASFGPAQPIISPTIPEYNIISTIAIITAILMIIFFIKKKKIFSV
jgi:hypothetical protein